MHASAAPGMEKSSRRWTTVKAVPYGPRNETNQSFLSGGPCWLFGSFDTNLSTNPMYIDVVLAVLVCMFRPLWI